MWAPSLFSIFLLLDLVLGFRYFEKSLIQHKEKKLIKKKKKLIAFQLFPSAPVGLAWPVGRAAGFPLVGCLQTCQHQKFKNCINHSLDRFVRLHTHNNNNS
jgi:hypothetical protein